MTMHKALHLKDDVDKMYQEERWEDDMPALKTAWTHQYYDSEITYKSAEEATKNNTRGPAERQ